MAPPASARPGWLVVIGASAGGVGALLELAASLPAAFSAPVCVVLHVGNNHSIMPELLANRGRLRAVHARDGDALVPGRIFIAPPDNHLLVEDGRLRLTRGPRENHTRPAVDPLFRSAALSWGARCIGVILTGYLDDGTAGLAAVKLRQGTTVVEDPATAYQPSMPRSALENVEVDFCVPVQEIGPLLARLVARPVPEDAPAPDRLVHEVEINMGSDDKDKLAAIAAPSSLTCPDCGGALWELNEQRPLRYRCHTGHAFTARTLEHAQAEAGELALRSSVRALAEREMLVRRMAHVSEATGDLPQAEAGRRHADRLRAQIDALRAFTESTEGQEVGEANA